MKYVLSSSSERRKELLKRVVPEFVIFPSNFDEDSIEFNGDIANYVMKISEGKVRDIIDKFSEDDVIIGCDTVVYCDGKVLGKPKDKKHAFEMLNSLSDKTHSVYSGITVAKGNKIIKEYVCTKIKFSKLTNQEIMSYIGSGEPFGKAGSYAIQGLGGVFIEEIHGCYYNVVGLPLNKLKHMLSEIV